MTASPLLDSPVLPPSDKSALEDVLSVLLGPLGHAQLRGADGTVTDIPDEVYSVLMQVVNSMKAGKAITVAPINLLLSTQEAAGFLGISRPSVVKLLTSREIPFEQPGQGRHRKIRLADLVEYQQRNRFHRAAQLSTMIQSGAEDGFYEEAVPEDYLRVVESVRQSRAK